MEDTILNPYAIKKGLSDKQVDQLINYAQTDEGLKYTSDPKRFKDKKSFDEFSKEILAYYSLTDEEDNLLGIIWFHDLPIPIIASNEIVKQSLAVIQSSAKQGVESVLNQDRDADARDDKDEEYGISFAIRLYGEARGKGLALPFTEKVMSDFKETEEYKSHPHKKIWLAVSPENEPAVALYRKLGFKELEIDKEHNKLLMVLRD